jgi:hypothetical protein
MNTKKYIEYKEPRYGEKGITITNSVIPHPEAEFAMGMIERMSLYCANPDGEDSAGRAKLRLMTPEEIANRACDIAAAAFAQFEKRDWLLQVPPESEFKKLTENSAAA